VAYDILIRKEEKKTRWISPAGFFLLETGDEKDAHQAQWAQQKNPQLKDSSSPEITLLKLTSQRAQGYL